MTTTTKHTAGHTALPWAYEIDNGKAVIVHQPDASTPLNGRRIAVITQLTKYMSAEEATNARLISRAVNSHQALLDACRLALEVIRRHNLEPYCGEDEITDPDGVLGIGDVLKAAIALVEKGME